MALLNRYDFVMLFDVEMVIQTATPMREMHPELMLNRDMDILQMFVLSEKYEIMLSW